MRSITWVLMLVLLSACGASSKPGLAPTAAHEEAGPPLDEATEDQVRSAVAMVDDGKAAEAIPIMQQLLQRIPGQPVLVHELALAFIKAKQPKGAIELLQANSHAPGFEGSHYDLWTTALDEDGQFDRSLAVADHGIAKFPTFGLLYTNAGITALRQGKAEVALHYFENGIAAAPEFPSNFYWAARVFSESSEKVWTLIYGEVFMNLEPNSQRTTEMSKMLYDTLNKSMVVSGSGPTVNAKIGLTSSSIIDGQGGLPFALAYEATFGTALLGEVTKGKGALNLPAIHQARTQSIDMWFSQDLAKQYRDHALLRFQRDVATAGHAEAYSYWLYNEGSQDEAKAWLSDHSQAWQSFITWFADHRMHSGGNVARSPR
jgi:tetratricopeptide (TPR) repeat protein